MIVPRRMQLLVEVRCVAHQLAIFNQTSGYVLFVLAESKDGRFFGFFLLHYLLFRFNHTVTEMTSYHNHTRILVDLTQQIILQGIGVFPSLQRKDSLQDILQIWNVDWNRCFKHEQEIITGQLVCILEGVTKTVGQVRDMHFQLSCLHVDSHFCQQFVVGLFENEIFAYFYSLMPVVQFQIAILRIQYINLKVKFSSDLLQIERHQSPGCITRALVDNEIPNHQTILKHRNICVSLVFTNL